MVYCIGLTGGLASGKSTAAKQFADLGVQVIYADQISKELSAKNQPAYHEMVQHFGTEILDSHGDINRTQLRTIVFNDTNERLWLEQLLHPLIRQKIKDQVDSCAAPYCIVEIPLLIDKDKYPYIKRILLVKAPQELQISRVMERDNCSREQALSILASQPHESKRMLHADDIVTNDTDREVFRAAINNLHYKYLQLAAETNT